MFIRLDKTDVSSITNRGGADKPLGDVYVNVEHISHIDGVLVIVGDYCICCTDIGLGKVLSAIEGSVKNNG